MLGIYWVILDVLVYKITMAIDYLVNVVAIQI